MIFSSSPANASCCRRLYLRARRMHMSWIFWPKRIVRTHALAAKRLAGDSRLEVQDVAVHVGVRFLHDGQILLEIGARDRIRLIGHCDPPIASLLIATRSLSALRISPLAAPWGCAPFPSRHRPLEKRSGAGQCRPARLGAHPRCSIHLAIGAGYLSAAHRRWGSYAQLTERRLGRRPTSARSPRGRLGRRLKSARAPRRRFGQRFQAARTHRERFGRRPDAARLSRVVLG